MDKVQLRKDLLKQRDGLSEELRLFISTKVTEHLRTYIEASKVNKIGSYSPIQGEIDIEEIENRMPRVRFYFPKVVDPYSKLLGWGVRPLKPGFKNINEPTEASVNQDLDMLLAPCIGFNDDGYRLGYGGGFYDRYLNSLQVKPHIVGISYALSRVRFSPEVHDHKLDAVITESGINFF
jgi:5-formyltetrahydrofolate cyclo-ligase